MTDQLHIVCLQPPYPVAFGGQFDPYFKLVALHHLGVGIHLHCFTTGGRREPALEAYCRQVHYYPRKTGLAGISLSKPYIVSSRRSRPLAERLLEDDHPILVEGIHCTDLFSDPRFGGRRLALRLHNVEYRYYAALARNSSPGWKKLYYLLESRLLRSYEKQVAAKASVVLAVSPPDRDVYAGELGARNVNYLPVFTGLQSVTAREGKGLFCLYQGNLSVPENENAALWLLTRVFPGLDLPLVIAGRSPSARLRATVRADKNACLVADPSAGELQDLVSKAQCHVLPSFNTTGIKLKLIHALFRGRHCVVNDAAVRGSGLEILCHSCNGLEDFRNTVKRLYGTPFESADIAARKSLLEAVFDDQANARQLIRWIS